MIPTRFLVHWFPPISKNSNNRENILACTIYEVGDDKQLINLEDFEHVQVIRFERTKNLDKFPKDIGRFFKAFDTLIIDDCKLSKIERDDFSEMKHLREFNLEHSPIRYLNGDVFKDLKDIESIAIYDTKITNFGRGIFEGFEKLEGVFCIKNPTVNAVYFNEKRFTPPLNRVYGEYTRAPSLVEFNRIISNTAPCDSLCSDIKSLLSNDNFKDFTISIKNSSTIHGLECAEKCCNETFKIHKFLLIARSPLLAEKIAKSPDVRHLNLIDIPTVAFRRVLDYMYDGILPVNGEFLKMSEIYTVASRLKMEELRKHAKQQMKKSDQVDDNMISIVEADNIENLVQVEEKKEENLTPFEKFIRLMNLNGNDKKTLLDYKYTFLKVDESLKNREMEGESMLRMITNYFDDKEKNDEDFEKSEEKDKNFGDFEKKEEENSTNSKKEGEKFAKNQEKSVENEQKLSDQQKSLKVDEAANLSITEQHFNEGNHANNQSTPKDDEFEEFYEVSLNSKDFEEETPNSEQFEVIDQLFDEICSLKNFD